MRTVAFRDEMPARLNECSNRQNQGIRDTNENTPRFRKFKFNPISVHV